jgi:hypothetical protein
MTVLWAGFLRLGLRARRPTLPVIPAHAGTQAGQGRRPLNPHRPRKTLAFHGPAPPSPPPPHLGPRVRGDDGVMGGFPAAGTAGAPPNPPRHSRARGNPGRARAPPLQPAPHPPPSFPRTREPRPGKGAGPSTRTVHERLLRSTDQPLRPRPVPIWVPACAGMTVLWVGFLRLGLRAHRPTLPVIPAQAGTQAGQGRRPLHPPRPRKTLAFHGPAPPSPPRPHLGPRVRGDDGVMGGFPAAGTAGAPPNPPRHSRARGNPGGARAPAPPPAPSTNDSFARSDAGSSSRPHR